MCPFSFPDYGESSTDPRAFRSQRASSATSPANRSANQGLFAVRSATLP